MRIEGRHVAAQEDVLKEMYLGDREAERRNEKRLKAGGEVLRKSRAAAEEMAGKIAADLGLDETKEEYLRHTLQAPIFEKLAAETGGPQAVREQGPEYGRREADQVLAKGFELLAKIYGSGNQVLIRAIIANLLAFGEAIDNKQRAIDAESRLVRLEGRLEKLEKQLARAAESGEGEEGGEGQK